MKRLDRRSGGGLALAILGGWTVLFAQGPAHAKQGQSNPIAVWGHERLGWDQRAASPLDLGRMVFNALIDGRFEEPVEDVVCASVEAAAGYECSSRLPRMAPGTHSIQLSTRAASGLHASAQSLPLYVTLQSSEAKLNPLSSGITVNGVLIKRLDVEAPPASVVAIAPLPDGRVFVGDRDGRIVLISGGRSTEAAQLRRMVRGDSFELLALTLDPEFESTRALYAVYTDSDGVTAARLHESNGVLASHVVIRSGLPAASNRSTAALGIGPDRKIYLALPRETDIEAKHRDVRAGTILRMNLDGTTPSDSFPTPVFAHGIQHPTSISWSADGRLLWLVGVESGGLEIRALNFATPSVLGAVVHRYSVAASPSPDGRALAAASNGEIVVTAEPRSLLRIVSDPDGTIRNVEWLLRNHLADVHAVGFRPGDHDVFVSSSLGVFQLVFTR